VNPVRAARAAVILAASGLTLACGSPPPDFDLLLVGGMLLDGTGAAARQADVGITDGEIVELGALSHRRATRVLDASGLVVAPGFIDLHSHADLILLADRETQERLMAAKIGQGVTSVIVGNCGLGPAPASPEAETILAGVNGWMTPSGVEAGALSIGEYLRRLETQGVALNVGTLVPHGPIRISEMGLADGEPSKAQLNGMRSAVDQALAEGAFGLSVGLIYPPGMYSATPELVALGRGVAAEDRLFTAHVRGSSETLVEATEELIRIARLSGVRVHHSHLEAVGERFWPDIERVLALEDAARADGLRVSHDVFPYTRAATMMSAIFPPWALEGGVSNLLERLADPTSRDRMALEIEERVPEWPPWVPGGWPHNLVGAVGWDGVRVASLSADGTQEMVGRSLAELAASNHKRAFDVVVDLMLSEDGRVGQFVDEISGRGNDLVPLLGILDHPAGAIISDAEDYGRGAPHPAHAGAFARALRLDRERGLGRLADVVRRMTSYPASLLGLEDRGVIRVGAHADLVVFDSGAVADRATWDEPRLPADGIMSVMINGEVVIEGGVYRGGLIGRILRPPRTGSDHEPSHRSD
jgi:N-acyl-D-aspartate/D-glutamate deacylase